MLDHWPLKDVPPNLPWFCFGDFVGKKSSTLVRSSPHLVRSFGSSRSPWSLGTVMQGELCPPEQPWESHGWKINEQSGRSQLLEDQQQRSIDKVEISSVNLQHDESQWLEAIWPPNEHSALRSSRNHSDYPASCERSPANDASS